MFRRGCDGSEPSATIKKYAGKTINLKCRPAANGQTVRKNLFEYYGGRRFFHNASGAGAKQILTIKGNILEHSIFLKIVLIPFAGAGQAFG
jgi:hypothetical protein